MDELKLQRNHSYRVFPLAPPRGGGCRDWAQARGVSARADSQTPLPPGLPCKPPLLPLFATPLLALAASLPGVSAAAIGTCTSSGDAPAAWFDQNYCPCTETLEIKIVADDRQIIECDLDVGTPTTPTDDRFYGVTSYTPDHDYSFFGRDEDGNTFCCVVDHETSYKDFYVVALGTDENDYMSIEDFGGLTTAAASPHNIFFMSTELHGRAGEDELRGFDGTDPAQNQRYYGGANDDEIFMGGTSCEAWGGLGHDTIDARDTAKPTAYGDLISSTILGGDDVILANTSSGLDAFGGPGADVFCGNGGNDNFNGQDGNDRLWGADSSSSGDELDGGLGYDRCDGLNITNETSCEASLPIVPSECL